MSDAAEMQRGFLGAFSPAGGVHEEWQHPARNHSGSIENIDGANAQQASQARQEHSGSLGGQRCAYYRRQNGMTRPRPLAVSGSVG